MSEDTISEVALFARNLILHVAAFTVALAIPVWAIILTFRYARLLFGID